MTAAHQTDRLAELVCSNTFKSVEPTNAHGLLKAEMRRLGSIVLQAADEARVPGGTALAVDRVAFAEGVQRRVLSHPSISVVRGEVTGGDDYLNSPLTEPQYEAFVAALVAGEQYQPGGDHEFDKVPYFEGCLPIEEMAERGPETLRHGPMKPFGLVDPRARDRGQSDQYAVIQLRQEDRAGQMWNLVGFQTRLKIPDQQRIFRTIPGLEHAEFLRYGSIHRNSYVNAPQALTPHLSAKDDARLLFAGQLTGVEGYTESAASGMLAGINLARLLAGEEPLVPPPTTMLGALYRYLREADPAHFQPMNANFGLVEPLETPVKDKVKNKEALVERAMGEIDRFAAAVGCPRAEAWARPDAVLKDSDPPSPPFRVGTP